MDSSPQNFIDHRFDSDFFDTFSFAQLSSLDVGNIVSPVNEPDAYSADCTSQNVVTNVEKSQCLSPSLSNSSFRGYTPQESEMTNEWPQLYSFETNYRGDVTDQRVGLNPADNSDINFPKCRTEFLSEHPSPGDSIYPESHVTSSSRDDYIDGVIDGVDDCHLTQLSVRDLNKKLVGRTREEVLMIKKKRRTLKNRGYAQSCRWKRAQVWSKLEQKNSELEVHYSLPLNHHSLF